MDCIPLNPEKWVGGCAGRLLGRWAGVRVDRLYGEWGGGGGGDGVTKKNLKRCLIHPHLHSLQARRDESFPFLRSQGVFSHFIHCFLSPPIKVERQLFNLSGRVTIHYTKPEPGRSYGVLGRERNLYLTPQYNCYLRKGIDINSQLRGVAKAIYPLIWS